MNEITSLMQAETANPPASGVDLELVMSRGRRRRRRRAIAVSAGASLTAMAVVAGLLVANNLFRGGPSSPVPGPPGGPPPGASSDADPEALLGVWAVSGTGERGEVRLRLGAREFEAVLTCGRLVGDWKANAAGQFVADVGEFQCDSGAPTGPAPGWLARAAGFRIEADGAVLLDASGSVLARLSPRPDSDVPAVVPDDAAAVAAFRAASAIPAPLPDGLTPATAQRLVGRWLPVKPRSDNPREAYLGINADGSWEGSDGCNGLGGRWIGGPDGLVMATMGVMTLIGCNNDQTAEAFPLARRAGFDGDVLVLVSAAGSEMARLRPAGR
jgi:heat shock protein HslJ